MDSKIEEILHSAKAYLFVDTDKPETIEEVLASLGFQDGGRDRPHEGERVLVDAKPRRPNMVTPEGDKITFESCYGVGTTCYSRVEDCPVPLEIANALHEKGLRVAVFDNKDFTGYYLIESRDSILPQRIDYDAIARISENAAVRLKNAFDKLGSSGGPRIRTHEDLISLARTYEGRFVEDGGVRSLVVPGLGRISGIVLNQYLDPLGIKLFGDE